MNFKNLLLDLVFPRHCLGCKIELPSKQASLICEACFGKIILNSALKCHICGLRNNKGVCKNCRKKTNLKIIFSAGHYSDPILREAIHAFKYHSIEYLKETMAGLMIKYIKKERLENKFAGSILVPIPLTLRRRITRGFNQSELLANEFSKFLKCPVINLLKRRKFVLPQAEIPDWQKRKENISGAFILSPPYPQNYRFLESIKMLKVILVDDVATSGATLEEAARVLKEAGVIKEVYGLVVAKG